MVTLCILRLKKSFNSLKILKSDTDNIIEYNFESNKREIEVEWKPNRLFAFNNMDKAWHYYKSGNQPRIVLQSFFVDLNKVLPNKEEWDHLIDLDGKYYF